MHKSLDRRGYGEKVDASKWKWPKEKIRFAQRCRDPSWNIRSPKICVRGAYTT